MEIATVIVDDAFLKKECYLFNGSKVKVISYFTGAEYYDCYTMAGKYVRLKANELKFPKPKKDDLVYSVKEIENLTLMGAFALYKRSGEEYLKEMYPDCYDFIMQHKDLSFQEFTELIK